MSRVQGVIGRAIKVSIYDVVDGDILDSRGGEGDPIIERVERDGDRVRFHYKHREPTEIQKELNITPVAVSNWMGKDVTGCSGFVFIHDLRNERKDYER